MQQRVCFNCNNFVALAALAEECTLLSAILVIIIITAQL